MISATSRYASSTIVVATNLNGTDVQVIVPSQQVNYTITFIYHQVTAIDTVDRLASLYYNDPAQWWRIADANPEIMLWDTLTVGSLIRIPNAT
jgi:hypothetical protein